MEQSTTHTDKEMLAMLISICVATTLFAIAGINVLIVSETITFI